MVGGQALAHGDHHNQAFLSERSSTSSFIFEASPQPNLPFVDLGVIDSLPGETKHEYMLRVGQILDRFTAVSGHEGCGGIMVNKTGDAWRVRLITNRSQVACVNMIFNEPGYTLTDETIHSHPLPRHGSIYANIQDQRLRGFKCGRRLRIDDADFSPDDLKNGPGYLVARGKLLYQRDGRKVIIGDIKVPDVIEGLVYIPNDTGRMSAPRNLRTILSSMVKASHHPAWGKSDVEGLPAVSCKAGRVGVK